MLKYITSICLLCLALVTHAYPYAFIFGDSLSDEGNFYAATNDSFPASPPYFNGRFTNGPVWAEFAYPIRLNFSYGGAMTNFENLFESKLPPSMQARTGLLAQIKAFEEMSYAPEVFQNTMIYINIGSNDIFYILQQPDLSREDLIEFTSEMVEHIRFSTLQLKERGVEHITVMGLSDLTLTPRFSALIESNTELDAIIHFVTRQFNTRLRVMAALHGLTYFDMENFMYEAIDNPELFGFTNVTDACMVVDDTTSPATVSVCPNPAEYFFWDDVHPTTRVHEIFAQEILRQE